MVDDIPEQNESGIGDQLINRRIEDLAVGADLAGLSCQSAINYIKKNDDGDQEEGYKANDLPPDLQ